MITKLPASKKLEKKIKKNNNLCFGGFLGGFLVGPVIKNLPRDAGGHRSSPCLENWDPTFPGATKPMLQLESSHAAAAEPACSIALAPSTAQTNQTSTFYKSFQ